MTAQTTRQKNQAHQARQASKVRPVTPTYNFEDLDRAVRSWVTGSTVAKEEVYSPYLGAL
jgi:hypothetical protein